MARSFSSDTTNPWPAAVNRAAGPGTCSNASGDVVYETRLDKFTVFEGCKSPVWAIPGKDDETSTNNRANRGEPERFR
jgi:hypothetical protein